MRSGWRNTNRFHHCVAFPVSLWWLVCEIPAGAGAFSKAVSINQPTSLQFNMAQEKRKYLLKQKTSLVTECMVLTLKNCYVQSLAVMKSPCVLIDLFNEITRHNCRPFTTLKLFCLSSTQGSDSPLGEDKKNRKKKIHQLLLFPRISKFYFLSKRHGKKIIYAEKI